MEVVSVWGLAFSARQQAIRQEDLVLSSARGGLGWMLERNPSQKW